MDELRLCVNNQILSEERIIRKKVIINRVLTNLKPSKVQEDDVTVLKKAVYYLIFVTNLAQDSAVARASRDEIDTSVMFRPARAHYIFELPVSALYYYLKYYNLQFTPAYYIVGFKNRFSMHRNFPENNGRQIFETIKSLITLSRTTYDAAPPSAGFTEARSIYSAIYQSYLGNHKQRDKKYKHILIYTLIDLGFHPHIPIIDLVAVLSRRPSYQCCNCVETMSAVSAKARRNPLTLLQITRLAVRRSMKDVDVLADCYRLDLPKKLQHYVSFSSVGAQVRRWLLTEEQNTSDDDNYDVVESVCKQYDVEPPLKKPHLNTRYCNHERLE